MEQVEKSYEEKNSIYFSNYKYSYDCLFFLELVRASTMQSQRHKKLPLTIKKAIESNNDNLKFSIFQDESVTYIYYKSDSNPNEYITTNLGVSTKGGQYIVSAQVEYAVNDDEVSHDKLIKVNKIWDIDVIFKEKIER